jgi:flagellar basal body rod protein FlgC
MESALTGMTGQARRLDRAAERIARREDTLTRDVTEVTQAARHHEANAAVFRAASDMMRSTIDLLL